MEKFKIYIDRLKNGHVEKIRETVSSAFLDIHEEELSFPQDVEVAGEIYLADEHLVGHFFLQTAALIPCSICNEPVKIPIVIEDAYITVELAEVHTAIYDLSDELREAILLQVPLFSECNEGKCPVREQIKGFLHPESPEKAQAKPNVVHFPFADLDKT